MRERFQAILDYVERLRQGDRQVRLIASAPGDDLARLESALDELGLALKNRDDLALITQQASASNLRRLDELVAELGRARRQNEQQQQTIQLLSTPILRVWDSVLLMPVLGAVDAAGAARMMERLLAEVETSGSRYAIIDLTGVQVIEPSLSEQIRRVVRAVGLLGAQGILVGIQPGVAHAVVSGGVDLAGIPTLATVRDALVQCMQGRGADASRS